jgi:TPR repeat protein
MIFAVLLGACGDHDEEPASTWVTTDEHGRTVRVTTVPAPIAEPATLSDLRARCDRSDRAACGQLANFLLNAGDEAEAEEVWYANCLAGHGPSCADLGAQYNNPYIRLAHPERALDVLTRGCEAAEHPPMACASLAERYSDDAQTRFGTPPDPARERALLERACRDGHYWSCDAIGAPPPP